MISDEGVKYRASQGTRENLLVGNFIDLNVMVADRDVVQQLGGFDESLRRAVDYDLVLRLSNLAPPSSRRSLVPSTPTPVRTSSASAWPSRPPGTRWCLSVT